MKSKKIDSFKWSGNEYKLGDCIHIHTKGGLFAIHHDCMIIKIFEYYSNTGHDEIDITCITLNEDIIIAQVDKIIDIKYLPPDEKILMKLQLEP